MDDNISTGSAGYLDDLYEDFLQDPNSVPEEWLDYFQELGASSAPRHPALPFPCPGELLTDWSEQTPCRGPGDNHRFDS